MIFPTWSTTMSLDIRRRRHSRVTSLASLRTISMWSSSLFSSSSLICLRYLSLSTRLWENWCWASSLARNACSEGPSGNKQPHDIHTVIHKYKHMYVHVYGCTAQYVYCTVCVCFHLVPLLLHLLQLYGDGVYAVAIHLTVLLQRGALQLQILLLLQILHTHTHTQRYHRWSLFIVKTKKDDKGRETRRREKRDQVTYRQEA